jgi:enoyl-[acyl-carrier protein] reductase II
MRNGAILSLLNITYPIIQAGMVWCSGWRLASAVSNAGGLGLIGAGSMYPEVLRSHITKCRAATEKSFGVNIPLLYPEIEKLMSIVVEEKVKVVFTSAGNPSTWTKRLKDAGITVVHVVSSRKFALKSAQAGVDAIVAEGFEAGGHNGREETTTMCLLPMIRDVSDLPLIAAGGIASGRAMLAAEVLGADGVQVGSRFAVAEESSAHDQYKQKVLEASEGDTVLTLKQITPVRMLKNKFYEEIQAAEDKGASVEDLKILLGKGRAKRGIFEGNIEEGELEIGQVAAMITRAQPAALTVHELWQEYQTAKQELCNR